MTFPLDPRAPERSFGGVADERYRARLAEIEDGLPWQDPRALLARVLCFADDGCAPSRGLLADIEVVLGVADPRLIRLGSPVR